MVKAEARKQFDEVTQRLGIEHTFPFETAWRFGRYLELKGRIGTPEQFIPADYTPEQFRQSITNIENRIRETAGSVTEDKEIEKFNPLTHSYGEGCYVREVFNPKGELLVTKIHKVDHPFFLLEGEMSVYSEEGAKRLVAPHYGITKSGTKRIIYCHTDCIFVTVHVTKEKELAKIEKEIIAKDFDDLDKYKMRMSKCLS